jgi:peptidoglycan-associated lipoprotein
MMRRLTLLSLLVGLVGCPKPPAYPNCKTDEHCKEKAQRCVFGTCQQCINDKDCADGEQCQENVCKAKPECASNDDCKGASVCEKGACVAAPKTCQIDQECGEGKICKDKVCAAPDCAADQDCGADQACQDQRCVPLQAEAAGEGPCADKDGKLWAAVPFAFNLGDLSAEAKQRLDRIARCLTTLESAELGIVGHADERGTQEYNLHLGERRAQAIKRYLVNLGVDEKKLSVISYGEERPVAEGSDESSWQKNRRAEFKRP